eukprot:Nk52_evm31s2325 gene=Nk52_evmTU31s2325
MGEHMVPTNTAAACEAEDLKKHVPELSKVLNDSEKPLAERFRALFTLKNIGGQQAIDGIAKTFEDDSALLKHEAAYCLGQMQDPYSIPSLVKVLEDRSQEAMVRHEAGEALGAISEPETLPILEKYVEDDCIEVSETCQIAVDLVKFNMEKKKKIEEGTLKDGENVIGTQYSSVDPAPAGFEDKATTELRTMLLNEELPLFKRYRALFALRNRGDEESVLAIVDGFGCQSALFRHEIGYVLGQMQHPASVPGLVKALERMDENCMVRHECAEALGSIATEECMPVLKLFQEDGERVVKESCDVALDMLEYEQSGDFQYADTVSKLGDSAVNAS